MATKTAAKKAAGKKAASTKKTSGRQKAATKGKGKKGDEVADLEREIEEDLGEEFDFDGKTPTGSDLMGKTVTFTNDKGKKITGVVVEPDAEGDESCVVVEDEEAFWTIEIAELKVVGGGGGEAKAKKEEPKAASKGKGKPAKKDEDEPEGLADDSGGEDDEEPEEEDEEEAEAEEDVRERRMLPVADVVAKIPKSKLRDVDTESDRYQRIKADLKRRGQRYPIIVKSFGDPVITDGMRRLKAFEELGIEAIEVQEEDEDVKTAEARLWNSVLDNEMREETHWTDLARAFVKLTKGEITARQISRALKIPEGTISRMMAAVSKKGLLPDMLKVAEEQTIDGPKYSTSVFMELVDCDNEVQQRALDLMKDGKPITVQDVRNLKREAKKSSGGGEDGDEDGGSPTTGSNRDTPPAASSTYRALARSEIGDYLKVTVHGDHVEVRAHIEWDKKTFRNFDPVEEIKELFDLAYADEENCSINSLPELVKALNRLKSELAD